MLYRSVASKAPEPSFDAVLTLVDEVMKVGTRRYEFSSEAPWFVNTAIVQERTRSRLAKKAVEATWIEHEISAAEIIGEAADFAYPEQKEGLIAIGQDTGHPNQELASRSRYAAEARGNTSETSGRHWRQSRMKLFIRLTAKQLYRMIHYSDANRPL